VSAFAALTKAGFARAPTFRVFEISFAPSLMFRSSTSGVMRMFRSGDRTGQSRRNANGICFPRNNCKVVPGTVKRYCRNPASRLLGPSRDVDGEVVELPAAVVQHFRNSLVIRSIGSPIPVDVIDLPFGDRGAYLSHVINQIKSRGDGAGLIQKAPRSGPVFRLDSGGR